MVTHDLVMKPNAHFLVLVFSLKLGCHRAGVRNDGMVLEKTGGPGVPNPGPELISPPCIPNEGVGKRNCDKTASQKCHG